MPKVQDDQELLGRVKVFAQSFQTQKAAAQALGMGESTLSRFLKSGRTTGKNRQKMLEVIPENATDNATGVALSSIGDKIAPTLKVQDLHQIKRICEAVLVLVAAYEGRSESGPEGGAVNGGVATAA